MAQQYKFDFNLKGQRHINDSEMLWMGKIDNVLANSIFSNVLSIIGLQKLNYLFELFIVLMIDRKSFICHSINEQK